MAPRRPCWLRERAGLWLAGNDITHSQSEQLSQPCSVFGKHWELGIGIQKVTKQSLLLNLALSRKRRLGSVQTPPVLITGGEGVPVTLVETWWAREGRLPTVASALASRGTQEPGIRFRSCDTRPWYPSFPTGSRHFLLSPQPLPPCCTEFNTFTHQTDRQTHTPHAGSRKINSLVSQLTSLCPIFLGSVPCLFLVQQENSTGEVVKMTNWMKTTIFLPLMVELGKSMGVCICAPEYSPRLRSTHMSRPAITHPPHTHSRLQSVRFGKESGPSRSPVNGTQASPGVFGAKGGAL